MNPHKLVVLKKADETIDVCTTYKADLASLPDFNVKVIVLKGCSVNMHKQVQIEYLSNKGHTEDKNVAKEKLFAESVPFAAIPYAYAKNKKDTVMLSQVTVSESFFRGLRESVIGDTCRGILKVCTDNKEVLLPYGMDEVKPKTYEGLIVDFEQKLIGTPEYRGVIEAAVASFDADYDTMTAMLRDELDPMIELIVKSKPGLYAMYQKTRKVPKEKRRKLAMKCTTMTETGEPVGNVTVEIVGMVDPLHPKAKRKVVVKRTTEKGKFQIGNMAVGGYVAKGKKGKLVSGDVEFWVVEGETVRVNLLMR